MPVEIRIARRIQYSKAVAYFQTQTHFLDIASDRFKPTQQHWVTDTIIHQYLNCIEYARRFAFRKYDTLQVLLRPLEHGFHDQS